VKPFNLSLFNLIVLLLLANNLFASDLNISLKANGVESTIAIAQNDALSLSLGLSSGTLEGHEADWWLTRQLDNDWSSYNLSSESWADGLAVTYQGVLFNFGGINFSGVDSSAVGSYNYYFAVDSLKNSQLDVNILSYDSVTVNVYQGQNSAQDSQPFISVYDPSKACNGTTLLSDAHDSQKPALIEVNMLGQIIWQYEIPTNLILGNPIGLDAEILPNNNILFNLSNSGIYEIDRSGNIVWSYTDAKNSHDADRLSNGNTLFVFGNDDTQDDTQVKEIDTDGNLIWSWSAKDHYLNDIYADISRQGWTHINGVTRLSNGNTLVSLRNFDLSVELDPQGTPIWEFDWRTLGGTSTDPHEPELQSNDNLLVCMQRSSPYRTVEIERSSGNIVWSYKNNDLRTARDCDRLSNGNTLILAVLENGTETNLNDDESVIFEVTAEGEIVWQMQLKNVLVGGSPGIFYKAERVCNTD